MQLQLRFEAAYLQQVPHSFQVHLQPCLSMHHQAFPPMTLRRREARIPGMTCLLVPAQNHTEGGRQVIRSLGRHLSGVPPPPSTETQLWLPRCCHWTGCCAVVRSDAASCNGKGSTCRIDRNLSCQCGVHRHLPLIIIMSSQGAAAGWAPQGQVEDWQGLSITTRTRVPKA